jgi:cyclophilin family peptidyl-prolyl cis-trans isomerase
VFRGTIVMASTARDTEGSQFFLTTGSAADLDGTVSVFGRIVEGQDVADRLVEGDRLVKVEVVKPRPGTTYRPITLAQQPAPEPVATSPRR